MLSRTDDLATWLRYLEQLHPRPIDLGLERVREVYQRLLSPRPAPVCVLVGGTNGKGSTVAFLVSMLTAAGYRVGSYTSPHLLRYNERVNITGVDAQDQAFVDAFVRINAARGAVSLSYFEFGTLAAFLLLADAGLDVAVLEIGLGGRLDAVNLIDADAAILTSVDLDHQEFLGDTRAAIGWDKAHIFRAGRPAVVADLQVPDSVLDVVHRLGADLAMVPPLQPASAGEWDCPLPNGSLLRVPTPQLASAVQQRNAAAAIWAWWLLGERLPFDPLAAARGVATASVLGRLQRLPRLIETWVDVAHNPQAARILAEWLQSNRNPHNVAVFAALADKDLAGIAQPLADLFDVWLVVDLRGATARAAAPEHQATQLRELLGPSVAVEVGSHMTDALIEADRRAGPGGRVLIFGSFFTVAAALGCLETVPD